MNGSSQYCPNMVTTVSRVILALVRSVAVHSMNTFLVSSVILVCSPGKTNGSCHEKRVPVGVLVLGMVFV